MLYEIDFNDSQALWKFSCETVQVANDFLEARKKYAENVKTLKLALATAFGTGEIKDSISEDKAYLKLAMQNDVLRKALLEMIDSEQLYKGLEKVLEARQSLITFNQSLIKNQPR